MSDDNSNKKKRSEDDSIFLVLWICLGFLFSLLGVLISWLLARKGSPKFRDNAVWFSLMGFAGAMVAQMLFMIFTGTSVLDFANGFGTGQTPQSSVW